MDTPSTQILFSNTIVQLKEPGIYGEVSVSGTEAGKWDKHSIVLESKLLKKKNGVCQRSIIANLKLPITKAGTIWATNK